MSVACESIPERVRTRRAAAWKSPASSMAVSIARGNMEAELLLQLRGQAAAANEAQSAIKVYKQS